MKRVLVLAEPEPLFLPDCVARLARLHPLAAIVEVPPPPRRVALRRAWDAFGPVGAAALVVSELAARVVDLLSPQRFYSLRKVARHLGIPYERVTALHGPDCLAALHRHRPDVVLTQVSRRVRPELLERSTFWNKHCSLLPGYAGVLPVFWALLRGERELGVTIHEMDEEFDRGPILQQEAIPAAGHSLYSAYRALYDHVAPLVARALRGAPAPAPRPAERSYFGFPSSADRKAFRAAGGRFGVPFRLHPRVPL